MVALNNNGIFGGLGPPRLLSGKMILPPHLMRDTNAGMITTGARYYIVPFPVAKPTTFSGAKFFNSGAGDNGDKVKIAAYSESSSGGPGLLAKDFGEATLTAAAAIRTLASSWNAAPGMYYLELVSDNAVGLWAMSPMHQVTAVGYTGVNAQANLLGGFASELLGSGAQPRSTYGGDYVDGTYANFPEATSLTPTNSIFSYSDAGSGFPFPLFGLYA